MLPLKILNYVLFQLAWLACVVGAASGRPWIGPVVAGALVALHLVVASKPGREAAFLALCAVAGGILDSAVMATGWLSYPSGGWIPGIAPYWIIAMWVAFGTTFSLSMAWLRGRPLLAALLGATGAPLSYMAGAKLGGVVLADASAALTVLAAAWALLLPLLAAASQRLDGFGPQAAPARLKFSWPG